MAANTILKYIWTFEKLILVPPNFGRIYSDLRSDANSDTNNFRSWFVSLSSTNSQSDHPSQAQQNNQGLRRLELINLGI